MKVMKLVTAVVAAASLLSAAGPAFANVQQSGASRLSLAAAPVTQSVRATSLKRKNSNLDGISTPLLIAALVAAGLGIAAAAGAFGGSDSP